jgi:hypothetical protein
VKNGKNILIQKLSTLTDNYLAEKFPLIKEKSNIIINGAICPNANLVAEINQLEPGMP